MVFIFIWACLALLSAVGVLFLLSAVFVGMYKAIKAEFTNNKEG